MDLSTLAAQVQSSTLLSTDERLYWLKNLPRMTQDQLDKLTDILRRAGKLAQAADNVCINVIGKAVAAHTLSTQSA